MPVRTQVVTTRRSRQGTHFTLGEASSKLIPTGNIRTFVRQRKSSFRGISQPLTDRNIFMWGSKRTTLCFQFVITTKQQFPSLLLYLSLTGRLLYCQTITTSEGENFVLVLGLSIKG